MEKPEIKIFTDFDGTITLHDVWIDVGEKFIADKQAWAETIRRFENLEIGGRKCFGNELELMVNFDFDEFNNIIDSQQIDVYFPEFFDFCRKNYIELNILSEGMDYYIDRVLKKHNLDIPYYANKLVIETDDKKMISLEYPYSDSDCDKCGCCKRNLLLNMTPDDAVSVYIGDGFSDACVSHYADIVFAKRSLASYCWKNNITYFEYSSFRDITKKLQKILQQKNIKHRQTAKFKRREVFLRG